ncbi:MAG: MmcQ/YjbR family DNA-binding protein [Roseburia sp.]|nr:MmcQ/YjbR family DNA-binding protein [Roseburia sp.]
MSRDEIFAYVKEEYGVEPDYPFDRDFESAVLRHGDTGKWFALVMYVRGDRLGYDSEERIAVITMKSEPMLIDSLVRQKGCHRAYHMNKSQWLTVELDGAMSKQDIRNLIDMSFALTEKGKKKRKSRSGEQL